MVAQLASRFNKELRAVDDDLHQIKVGKSRYIELDGQKEWLK